MRAVEKALNVEFVVKPLRKAVSLATVGLTAALFLGAAKSAVASDDIRLTQETPYADTDENFRASGKSNANLTVSGDGKVVLRSQAVNDSAKAVQSDDDSAGEGNTLILTVDTVGLANAANTTNTIYLSQRGGSYFVLGINGTGNTVTMANLLGSGNVVGEAVAVTVFGNSNTIAVNPATLNNIVNSLSLDIGASGTLSSRNTVYVDYSEMAKIAATLVSTTGYSLDIDQVDEANVYASDSVQNELNVDIDGATSGSTVITQTGVENTATVNLLGSNNVTIEQVNKEAGNQNVSFVKVDVGDGSATTIKQNAGSVDANATQSASVEIDAGTNTVEITQDVVSAVVASGDSYTVKNTAGFSLTGAGNTVNAGQKITGSDNITQSNVIKGVDVEAAVASDALIAATNSAVDITQDIGLGGQVKSAASNTLELSLSGESVDLDVTQNIVTNNAGAVGTPVSNTAAITNTSSYADITLTQTLTPAQAGTTAADINLKDGSLASTSVSYNDIDATQINAKGGSMSLVLAVTGAGNDIDVTQNNSSATGIDTDNSLNVTLNDDGATLSINALGSGTNTLTISGTGNVIDIDNSAGGALFDAISTTAVYGDSNTVTATDFDDLKIEIGDGSTALSGNTVTTSGNAYIKVLGSDGVSTQNTVNYKDGYGAGVSKLTTPTVKVTGKSNQLYISDAKSADVALGKASVTVVLGDSNKMRGYNGNGSDVAEGGHFILTDSALATITITGSSNSMYSSAAGATADDGLSGFASVDFDIIGSSNRIHAWGDGASTSTLDVDVNGSSNILAINAGNDPDVGDFTLAVTGDGNDMGYDLRYGTLSHSIVGDSFVGTVEGFGSSYYYQKLTQLGLGTITLATNAGSMTITAN